ncbi:MerR family transcriptional regulator [Williamsia sp. 1135]|uniref:MerR family transcriptional regulator n=1 Tax=Williamsia sp. 1135 TaxID=1889262 RepID=UPI001F0A67E4|nr:MerR family transcriptional regulator [Williamsia sp. 1135]
MSEGLFPPPQRSAGGRRGFSADDLAWIGICQRLRASGMPLPDIARYAELVRAGAGNESYARLRKADASKHTSAVKRHDADGGR